MTPGLALRPARTRACLALGLVALAAAATVGVARAEASSNARSTGEPTIVWGGDVHLGRAIAEGMQKPGHADPFDQIAPLLADADLRVANLEGPLTNAPRKVFGYYLTGDPDRAGLLARAGFDVLGLANNHATDNGSAGLDQTLAVLQRHGIATVGAGPLETAYDATHVTVGDLRVAIVAFNYIVGAVAPTDAESGVAEYDAGRIASAVSRAHRSADIVVAMPHWGVENMPAANGYQRRFAQALVDAGADAVIGHHPHVVQDVEWLPRPGKRAAFVAYSLGNLVFDSVDSDAQRGSLLWTVLDREGVRHFRALPVRNDWLGTVPLASADAQTGLETRLMPGANTAALIASSDGYRWFGAPDSLVEIPEHAALPTAACVWPLSASSEPLPF